MNIGDIKIFKKGIWGIMTLMDGIYKGLQSLVKSGTIVTTGGTRVSASVRENFISKIVLFGEKHKYRQNLGLTRIIRDYNRNGNASFIAEFNVNPSINGGFGGLRTLRGTPKQMAATFRYLNNTVNENCNTITALDNLEKLRPVLGDGFARCI